MLICTVCKFTLSYTAIIAANLPARGVEETSAFVTNAAFVMLSMHRGTER